MDRPVTPRPEPRLPALDQSTLPPLVPETASLLTLAELVELAEQTQRTLRFMTRGDKLRVPPDVEQETPWAPEAANQDAFRCGVCYALLEPLRAGLDHLDPAGITPSVSKAVVNARRAFNRLMRFCAIQDGNLPGELLRAAPGLIDQLVTGLTQQE